MKINWKKFANVSSREAILWHELADKRENELKARPVVEKIVKKEVLPGWAVLIFYAVLIAWVITWVWAFVAVTDLKEPLWRPYVIEAVDHDKYSEAMYDLRTCKDAWRDDERTIRQLHRRVFREFGK